MKNKLKKRIKKEVFVYERGIELFPIIGELTEDQVLSTGMAINEEKTKQLRELMTYIVKVVVSELAPSGIQTDEQKEEINQIIKRNFAEIAKDFDFNRPFYGPKGTFNEAKEKFDCDFGFELQCRYVDALSGMEIEEDFIY